MARAVLATISPGGDLASETERFRAVREKTLAALAEVSAVQALWSPRHGVWSIAQIGDHLLRSEELYRNQFRSLIDRARQGRYSPIQISLREVDTSLAGIPRETMRVFELPARMFSLLAPHALREMVIRYSIVPALNPGVSEPRSGLTVEKVVAGLTASLAETESLLRAPMPVYVERPTIVHPLMGSNNLPQLLRILIAHEERHQGQIARLRTHAGFPATPRSG